ncbi:MAG: alpha/beta hydrolase family protein [Pseudomonas sp.]
MPRPYVSTCALFCLMLALPLAGRAEDTAVDAVPSTGEQPAANSLERTVLTERSRAEAAALERQLPTSEQQHLLAGTEDFLALWQPANVGQPSGAVILLPGDGETANWPKVIGPLRRKLPDAGWHSLSLSLPDPQQAPLPELLAFAIHNGDAAPGAETAADPASAEQTAKTAADAADKQAAAATPATVPETAETAAADVPATAPDTPPLSVEEQQKAHAERVLARIEAGIAFAEQQQAQTIVLLGHGSGAYWAARYMAERQPDQVKHLLLVAPSTPAGFGPPVDEQVPALQLATGDFYYQEQLIERNRAQNRTQAATRQQHPDYSQVALKALPGNPGAEQEQLFRRIRGWLSKQFKPAES